MKDIVGSVGPISMALCADKRFKHYKGGVFSEPDCCTKNNHAPMITGYGTDPKHGDYWIIKNSWGTSKERTKFLSEMNFNFPQVHRGAKTDMAEWRETKATCVMWPIRLW